MNITKLELCSKVSKRLEIKDPSRKVSANHLEVIFETIIDEILTVMAEGKNIEIRGFGSFKVKTKKNRIGRNPRTGKVIDIPAYKSPTFKVSKDGQNNFDKKSGIVNYHGYKTRGFKPGSLNR